MIDDAMVYSCQLIALLLTRHCQLCCSCLMCVRVVGCRAREYIENEYTEPIQTLSLPSILSS